MTAEIHFKNLMHDASAYAWKKSNAISGTVSTSLYFTIRKAIRTSPAKTAVALFEKIPFVGAPASFVAGEIFKKVRDKRIKSAALGEIYSDEKTHKGSKALMKNMAMIATVIDGNMTKHEKALSELIAARSMLGFAFTSSEAWTRAFWRVAYAYYRVDHYNLKIASLMDSCKDYLKSVEEYNEKCSHQLRDGEDQLWKIFEPAYNEITENDQEAYLLPRGRSSSSSS